MCACVSVMCVYPNASGNVCLCLCLHSCRSLCRCCCCCCCFCTLNLRGVCVRLCRYVDRTLCTNVRWMHPVCIRRNVLFRKHRKVKWAKNKHTERRTIEHHRPYILSNHGFSQATLACFCVYACVWLCAVLHNQNKNIESVWNTHAWQTASSTFTTFRHFWPSIAAAAAALHQ